MDDENFLNYFKGLLEKSNQSVFGIEMTSGNYDDKGNLIAEEIPTLTTDFCEIGAYYNKICYFTIILYSESSFSNKLFDLIKDIDEVHIYGFKNFMRDYYPSEDSSFETIEQKIKRERYFQIQFNFDREKLNSEAIFKRYMELKDLFGKTSAQIINQITQDLRNSE